MLQGSSRPERVVLHCIHHYDKTRDTRNTEEVDPKCAWTVCLSIGMQVK